jgi:ribosomal protein S18 acetylase RimI-like enzyme
MKNTQFTPIKPTEFDDLYAMATLIWHQHYPSIISLKQIDYMLNLFYAPTRLHQDLEKGYQYLWIIDDEDTRVGFVAYVIDATEPGLFLSKLYVLPQHHGGGFGQAALNHLWRIVEKNNLFDLHLFVNKENHKAIKAYQRFGMSVAQAVVQQIGENFVMDDYIMQKRLAKPIK